MAMSVNMLRLRVRIERAPRLKNGQPAHKTTGVLSTNWIQREGSPESHAGAFGIRCNIARKKTGKARAAPIQKRRLMSINSELSSAPSAEIVSGSRAIPQIGHSPGESRWISGCIGQV